MATMYIAEYEIRLVGGVQVAVFPPVRTTTKAIGADVIHSCGNFSSGYGLVRLQPDAVCSISDAVATTSSPRMPADTVEYYAVASGQNIHIIANT